MLRWFICTVLLTFGIEVRSTKELLVYVGSYTPAINIFRFNSDRAELTYLNTVNDSSLVNPSWLTMSSDREFMYVVSEVEDYGGYSGSVSAYKMAPSRSDMDFINTVSSAGASPCHSHLNDAGTKLYVSNYCGGTVSILNVEGSGQLGSLQQVIDHNETPVLADCNGAHVHETVIDAEHCFVMDLGLDSIYQYRVEPGGAAGGNLTVPASLPPTVPLKSGSGPRHLVVHPSLDLAFLVSELDCTLTSLRYNRSGSGALEILDTVSSLRASEVCEEIGAAEIQLHPSAYNLPPTATTIATTSTTNTNTIPSSFLHADTERDDAETSMQSDSFLVYVSNRDLSEPNLGRNSVGVYEFHPSTGRLQERQHINTLGIHPRHFAFDPSGAHLLVANMNSDSIAVFPVIQQEQKQQQGQQEPSSRGSIRLRRGEIDPRGTVYSSEHTLSPTQLLIVEVEV